MPGGRGGLASHRQEILDDAVLERMERDDDEPAAGRKQALGRNEPVREAAKLVVDEDAQRLERAGRRVNVAGPSAHDAGDDRRELRRRADRLLAACGDDRPGDGARVAFLAERGDDRGKLPLRGARQDLGGTRPRGAHAHVERTL